MFRVANKIFLATTEKPGQLHCSVLYNIEYIAAIGNLQVEEKISHLQQTFNVTHSEALGVLNVSQSIMQSDGLLILVLTVCILA